MFTTEQEERGRERIPLPSHLLQPATARREADPQLILPPDHPGWFFFPPSAADARAPAELRQQPSLLPPPQSHAHSAATATFQPALAHWLVRVGRRGLEACALAGSVREAAVKSRFLIVRSLAALGSFPRVARVSPGMREPWLIKGAARQFYGLGRGR